MTAISRRNGGFTLLEMMLSIGIFLLLITSAFAIVGASTELMSEVSEAQNESAVRLRFVESCRLAFESTNRSSSIEFHHVSVGSQRQNSYLSFVDTPNAFDLGFSEFEEIERAVLASEFLPGGFLRTRVYYMTRDEFESVKRSDFSQIDSPYVELMPRVRQLDWWFFNETTQRWEEDLDVPFPCSLIKLVLRTDGSSTPLETTFFHLAATE